MYMYSFLTKYNRIFVTDNWSSPKWSPQGPYVCKHKHPIFGDFKQFDEYTWLPHIVRLYNHNKFSVPDIIGRALNGTLWVKFL
jgi:hypothetical protein